MLNVKCPSCGSYNDDTAILCYFCKKELPISAKRAEQIKENNKASGYQAFISQSSDYKRPGCITCYSLLYLIPGILGLIISIMIPIIIYTFPDIARQITIPSTFQQIITPEMQTKAPSSSLVILSSVLCFSYFIIILIGWGLWTMRNWARILIMFFLVVSTLGGFVNVIVSMVSDQRDTILLMIIIIPIIINFLIFTWFLWNRQRFR